MRRAFPALFCAGVLACALAVPAAATTNGTVFGGGVANVTLPQVAQLQTVGSYGYPAQIGIAVGALSPANPFGGITIHFKSFGVGSGPLDISLDAVCLHTKKGEATIATVVDSIGGNANPNLYPLQIGDPVVVRVKDSGSPLLGPPKDKIGFAFNVIQIPIPGDFTQRVAVAPFCGLTDIYTRPFIGNLFVVKGSQSIAIN